MRRKQENVFKKHDLCLRRADNQWTTDLTDSSPLLPLPRSTSLVFSGLTDQSSYMLLPDRPAIRIPAETLGTVLMILKLAESALELDGEFFSWGRQHQCSSSLLRPDDGFTSGPELSFTGGELRPHHIRVNTERLQVENSDSNIIQTAAIWGTNSGIGRGVWYRLVFSRDEFLWQVWSTCIFIPKRQSSCHQLLQSDASTLNRRRSAVVMQRIAWSWHVPCMSWWWTSSSGGPSLWAAEDAGRGRRLSPAGTHRRTGTLVTGTRSRSGHPPTRPPTWPWSWHWGRSPSSNYLDKKPAESQNTVMTRQLTSSRGDGCCWRARREGENRTGSAL